VQQQRATKLGDEEQGNQSLHAEFGVAVSNSELRRQAAKLTRQAE